MTEKKLKKVYIVIEETGEQNGRGFNCFLAGDCDRIGKTDQKDLTPAEFWGSRIFSLCIHMLRQSGVIKSETPKGKSQ